jgi:hypothetical protein
MLMVMNKNDENELVAAYFEARLSPEEQAALESRLAEDQDFADKVRLHASLLRLRQRRKNLHLIRQALGKNARASTPQTPTRQPPLGRLIASLRRRPCLIAACGLALLLAGLAAWWNGLPTEPAQNHKMRMATPRKLPLKSLAELAVQYVHAPDSAADTLEFMHWGADSSHRSATMLVSSDLEWADTTTWESSIHGTTLPEWLAQQHIDLPKKIDPQTYNRITVAVYVRLITQGHPERFRRLVLLGDLDLEEPKYFLGQDLFVFFPHDPRELDLDRLTLFRQGRRLVLQIGEQRYHIREHGTMDSLLQLPPK